MEAAINCPICDVPVVTASSGKTASCPEGHYSFYTEGTYSRLITERVGAFLVTYRKGDSEAREVVEELARVLRQKNMSDNQPQ